MPPRRMIVRTIHALICVAGSMVAAVNAQQRPPEPTRLGPAVPPEVARMDGGWPMAAGNFAATRATTNTGISTSTIRDLRVAWSFAIEADSPYAGGMTAPPVVVGDVVYVQDMASNVFAIDRSTGARLWSKTYDVPTTGPNGVAVAYGRVFGGLGDSGDAFALDASDGRELWRVSLTNNPGEGVDMAPTVFDSTVYISTVPGGRDGFHGGGQKGILFALDASTGDTLWTFDTTAGGPTGNLWGNARVNSGGGLWSPLSVDDDGNIYFGVANPGPFPGTDAFPNATSRPGPNHYTNSMVSLDPDTGSLRWFHAARPHDLFDLDFHLTPILVDVSYDDEGEGSNTRLAIGSGKNGVVVAVDASNGHVVWESEVGRHLNDGVEWIPPGRVLTVFPGALGGVETPMAYADGTVFAAVVNLYSLYTSTRYLGNQSLFEGTSELVALDAATGVIRWSVDLPALAFAAATVANDVVITGTMDGRIRAYDVRSGESVWEHQTAAGLNAPPAVAGDVLIVPSAGPLIGGPEGTTRTRQLIAFELP